MSLPRVTDHALIRYLERVQGIDMEWIRRHVAKKCAGLTSVRAAKIDGFLYVMRDGVVVTVRPIKENNARKVPRGRKDVRDDVAEQQQTY